MRDLFGHGREVFTGLLARAFEIVAQPIERDQRQARVHATLGELVAWIIGWDLVLEFTVGAAALSTGFSAYLQEVLDIGGVTLPSQISSAATGVIDLPAVVVALMPVAPAVEATWSSGRAIRSAPTSNE